MTYMIVTGSCECTGLLGPALGGGHGFLQGRHGLVSDQFVSMNIVLADGELHTIDESSDLWWAMQGAGHNFGIVTSVSSRIYNISSHEWAAETFIFPGAKVEDVYGVANHHLFRGGSLLVTHWSYWMSDPAVDPTEVRTPSLEGSSVNEHASLLS